MALMQDFKKFAMRGNVIDLAVGVIIGAAFGKIVDSLVNDLIMPLISRIVGKLDFSNLFIQLAEAPAGVPHTLADLKKAGVPVFAYGNFITVGQFSDSRVYRVSDGARHHARDRRQPAGSAGRNTREHPAASRDSRQPEEQAVIRRESHRIRDIDKGVTHAEALG